jgi:hypothetical protein
LSSKTNSGDWNNSKNTFREPLSATAISKKITLSRVRYFENITFRIIVGSLKRDAGVEVFWDILG